MSHKRRSLVFGMGNPMRGDDGLGAAVIERLYGEKKSGTVDMLVTHQLLPEYADMLRPYERVIFVDACVDLPAGEWRLARIGASRNAAWNTHQLDPPSLLTLAESLFEARPEAWCLRVGAEQFDSNQQLSPKVRMAIDRSLSSLVALTQFQGETARA